MSDSEDSHVYHNHYVATHSRDDGYHHGYHGYHHGGHHGGYHGGYHHGGDEYASHKHTVLGVNSCYMLDDILDKPFTLQYFVSLRLKFKFKCPSECG